MQNGPTLANRSSAEYDHVFLLEVDLEPAGPGLEPRRFSLTCDVIALSKIFQNGRTLANRSSAEYDHVFLLEVDLEPAGRDLNADIKSGTVGQPVCRKMPKNLNFTTSKKRFFGIFRRTGRPIFKPIFLPERSSQGLQKSASQSCCYNAPFGRYSVFRFFRSGFNLPLM